MPRSVLQKQPDNRGLKSGNRKNLSPDMTEPDRSSLVGTSWHTLSAEEVFSRIVSSPSGLSDREAASRLSEDGANELRRMQGISPWGILLRQLQNLLIAILLVAILLSASVGHVLEAIAITAIVSFAVLLGFIQEYRAERAIEALQRIAAPTGTVLRQSEEREIPASEVVAGDVVLIRAGDKIPADGRLFESVSLRTEEAALTGESVTVEKHSAPLADPTLAVGDRRNMVFAGTAATYGRGHAVVVATGMRTEFGQIAEMLEGVEVSTTPLQENLERVGRTLVRAATAIVIGIVGLGLIRGQPTVEMVIFGIALAVAVVPEALPAVVTISLAIGVQRMAKRNALVRRLPAVETLGSTSFICSDKTGTLTKGEMTVRRIFVAGQAVEVSGAGYEPRGDFWRGGVILKPPVLPPLLELLRGAALASDARLVKQGTGNQWRIIGDPTEGALVVAAAKAGLAKVALDANFRRINEIPFTPERKRMTTLHEMAGKEVAYSKGAPEVVLKSCTKLLTENGVSPLDPKTRESVLTVCKEMAAEAFRVLAVAYKSPAEIADAEEDLTLLGVVGMTDPLRAESKAAVRACQEAGIKPVMITGDHSLTAKAVAQELGLLGNGRIVTGADLQEMTDAELESVIESIEVYARVSPADKLRVVTGLQKRGHVVAMTGDGVNDAPALKKADIGIAMGIAGTDVTREAAAMTLLDDNFASIVAAVEEGRAIFGNIKKYLMYLLSSNIGEMALMGGASLLGLPLPLTAVQLLYVNLATDGLPALALSLDPPELDVMRRKPREPRASIFSRPVVALITVGGAWSAVVNLGLFIWAMRSRGSVKEAMTMVFVSLVLIQFFKAYNYRSDRDSLLNRPFANKWLNLAIVWELGLLALIIKVPWLREPFGAFDLRSEDWLVAFGLAFTICPVLELAKWMHRRGYAGFSANGVR
ncbi:MAG TPA: cation-translocating P-type ATPase [Kiloniellales bacterium]